jgi:two-component system, cell cycle response regulator DivK
MAAKLVLIVDDNADQRDITATLLRHHGYRIAEATGGDEAIRLARELHPDGILLDMMMGDRDGWTVTNQLKRDAETGEIPIIAHTVRFAPEDQEKAREAGVVGYVIKPCLPAAILEEVHRHIGPPTEA